MKGTQDAKLEVAKAIAAKAATAATNMRPGPGNYAKDMGLPFAERSLATGPCDRSKGHAPHGGRGVHHL